MPIKPLHKMSKAQILKEFPPNGFKLVEQFDKLPWQHVMFFRGGKRKLSNRKIGCKMLALPVDPGYVLPSGVRRLLGPSKIFWENSKKLLQSVQYTNHRKLGRSQSKVCILARQALGKQTTAFFAAADLANEVNGEQACLTFATETRPESGFRKRNGNH